MENDRHYCTCCQKKKYEKYMRLIHYPLIHERKWHCLECLSTSADNLAYDVTEDKRSNIVPSSRQYIEMLEDLEDIKIIKKRRNEPKIPLNVFLAN